MKQRYWHIEGYDSLKKIFDKKVKIGCISQNQIQDILKALAAKANLNFEEIVGAYAKKNSKIHNNLLLINKSVTKPVTYTCGKNPHFIARIVVENL